MAKGGESFKKEGLASNRQVADKLEKDMHHFSPGLCLCIILSYL